MRKQEQDLASQAHGWTDVSPGLISEPTHRSRRSKTSPARWRPREPRRWLVKAFAREAGSFTVLPVSGISSGSSLGDSEWEVNKLTACLKTVEAGNMQTTTMKGVSLHGLGVSLHGLGPSGEVYPVGDRERKFAAAEGPG